MKKQLLIIIVPLFFICCSKPDGHELDISKNGKFYEFIDIKYYTNNDTYET